jgi:hypothetical protein
MIPYRILVIINNFGLYFLFQGSLHFEFDERITFADQIGFDQMTGLDNVDIELTFIGRFRGIFGDKVE